MRGDGLRRIFDLLDERMLKDSCEISFESCLRHQNGRRTRTEVDWKGFLAAATVLLVHKERSSGIH
jgi:hypothetical protein